MKKYISAKSVSIPIYEIEIVAIMNTTADVNSSEDILKRKSNMPYEYQLSDKEFEVYKDFAKAMPTGPTKPAYAGVESR